MVPFRSISILLRRPQGFSSSFVRFNSSPAKIRTIVDQISQLTLIETVNLISSLKTKLNIHDIALPVATSPPTTAPVEEAPQEEKPKEKTMFSIKLEAVDASVKAKVIREVKNLLGLNLVDAKKFVESAPKILKEDVVKEEAEKMKATLTGLGAKVVLE